MKIELNRINNAYHFEATNETGNTVQLDASPALGGENKGVRPMELMLVGLAGCSSIDVISILKKQKQEVLDFKVVVDGDREKDKVPSLFETIHVTFILKGELSEAKVEKAIQLSMDKYCSVTKTLEKTAKITWSYQINKD